MAEIWAAEVLIFLFGLFGFNSIGGGDAGGKKFALGARLKGSFKFLGGDMGGGGGDGIYLVVYYILF